MKRKVRIDAKVIGYYFPSKPNLIFHSGKFWVNDLEAKLIYNNGSQSVLYGSSKLSIKKLRKEAMKCEVTLIDSLPF